MNTAFAYKPRDQRHVLARIEEYRRIDAAAKLDAALFYAEGMGWHIFPVHWPLKVNTCSCNNTECKNQAKHPLTQNGLLDATRDPNIIRTWWTKKWPLANIGIVTGAVSGIVVLDVDSIEALEEIKKFLQCPFNKITRAATSQGWHLVFAHPGVNVRTRSGVLTKVDCRGDGGYFIAHPSIHKTGKEYTWEVRAELQPLAPALLEIINCPTSSNDSRVQFKTAEALKGAPEGKRREMIVSLAGKLRHADIPFDWAERLVHEAWENCEQGEQPFTWNDALYQLNNVYGRYSPGTTPTKEAQPKEGRITLCTWAEFLATDFGGEAYTIEGLLPDEGLWVNIGRGKHGKSTLMFHGLRAIGYGSLFLGKQTVQKPVVYINYEMGKVYVQKLMGAGGPPPGEAFIFNRPERPVLTLPWIEDTMKAVEDAVGKRGVLSIDSFRGAFRLRGEGENLSGEAGILLRDLQDMALDYHWLIGLIHHRNRSTREGADSVSGSGDWIAAPDMLWTWSRPDIERPGTLTLEGRIEPIGPLVVKLTLEECICTGTVVESVVETDDDLIFVALTNEGKTIDQIVEITGLVPSTAYRRCERLLNKGLIKRQGKGGRNDAIKYSKLESSPDLREGTMKMAVEELQKQKP